MRFAQVAAVAIAATACGSGGEDAHAPREVTAQIPSAPVAAPRSASAPSATRWHLDSGEDGVTLSLLPRAGAAAGERAAIRLACPAGGGSLLVNLPRLVPIASEERLSFGSGGEVVALVADIRGDSRLGGVSGVGPVPRQLAALIAAPISASYGARTSGPHSPPPPALARAFVAACGPAPAPVAAGGASAPSNPCRVQGDQHLAMKPLRAIGTEPFWGARIEGRCVTYSHPEDQDGIRIWTRFTAEGAGGRWTGALGGRTFELVTRPAAGCSDGMSDNRYPLAVALTVNGERRTGCAGPA